ncbi:MAG TPA: serine hydrolase [Gammaproteobacteria bacterium]|nr:serine hydrolase [Gammaproteobacteria bacterium]
MRNKALAITAVFGCIISAVQPAAAQEPAPLRGLDHYIEQSMHAWHVPGLAIAVVKDGKVVMEKGYGVRTLDTQAKVDKNTLFSIASNSKAFTAASIGMLVDADKLGWDSPVTDYLPDFQLYNAYPTRQVRIRDLLTHRTGYCGNSFLWYDTDATRAEVLHSLRLIKPQHSFRSQFCYSNIMFMAAGQIVQTVSGKSWDDFIKTRFFEPLGMTHSDVTIAAMSANDDAATPYAMIDGKLTPLDRYYQKNIAPAGAINSNVDDMTHWLLTLLADGEYNGHRILSQAVVKEMETPQIPVPADALELHLFHDLSPKIHSLSYGLALFMEDYRGEHIVWHYGEIDGMTSAVGMIPDRHLGVVVLTNLNTNWLPLAVMYRVFDAYLGAPAYDWSARAEKVWAGIEAQAKSQAAKLAPPRAAHPKMSAPVKDYVGTYTSPFGKATVTLENGHLVIKHGRKYVGDLTPWNRDTFHVVWRYRYLGDTWCHFLLGPAGRIDKLKLFGLDTYTRQK